MDEAEGHYRIGLELTERERCVIEQGRFLQGLADVGAERAAPGGHAAAGSRGGDLPAGEALHGRLQQLAGAHPGLRIVNLPDFS